MSILQQLLGKIKGVTPTPPEETAPTQGTQPPPVANIPTLKQPIQYSFEMILKAVPLSKEFSTITEGLLGLSTKEHLQTADVIAFQEQLVQEIQRQKEVLRLKKQQLAEKKDVLAALDYLETFAQRITSLGAPLSSSQVPTFETFATCAHALRMEACKEFLKEWRDGSQTLKTSPVLKEKLTAFDIALVPVQQSLDALHTRIGQFQSQGEMLKSEISQFSQALAKIKSMGKAGMDQYYDSLTEVKHNLNDKRQAYVEEEEKLNQFITVILLSIEEALGAFAPLVPEIQGALKESAQEIKEHYAHFFTETLTPEAYHHLTAEVAKLEQLKEKIADAQALHHYFP